MDEGGKKNDQNKPSITLAMLRGVWQVAEVMTFEGAVEYGRHNWKKGLQWSRMLDAAFRHLIQFAEGEDLDSKSGRSHLAHAACEVLMLLETTMDRPDLDDRYKGDVKFPWKDESKKENVYIHVDPSFPRKETPVVIDGGCSDSYQCKCSKKNEGDI